MCAFTFVLAGGRRVGVFLLGACRRRGVGYILRLASIRAAATRILPCFSALPFCSSLLRSLLLLLARSLVWLFLRPDFANFAQSGQHMARFALVGMYTWLPEFEVVFKHCSRESIWLLECESQLRCHLVAPWDATSTLPALTVRNLRADWARENSHK